MQLGTNALARLSLPLPRTLQLSIMHNLPYTPLQSTQPPVRTLPFTATPPNAATPTPNQQHVTALP